MGRVFVIRLEDGDVVHECIERFARVKKIRSAAVIMVGGADKGSRIVVGPRNGRAKKIVPMPYLLNNVYETGGVGTIFPDSKGNPVLHSHNFFGRNNVTRSGCVRLGVKTWHIMEVVIIELTGTCASRKKDRTTGFELLIP